MMRLGAYRLLILVTVLTLPAAGASPFPGRSAPASNWTTYLGSNARSNDNPAETTITPATVGHLTLRWSLTAGGDTPMQPSVANGLVYWGSWDGYERATTLAGSPSWITFLGQSSGCGTFGVTGAATIATVPIGGQATSVLFVGGGNAQVYALNALSGQVLWHTPVNAPPSPEVWSSPAVYNGSVYVGVSGLCVNVPGQLLQLNASTGAIQHVFNVAPAGCTGGGVWGSPTIDETSGTLFFATGDESPCPTAERYTDALVAVRAADLSLISAWQIPASQRISDGDIGSTPTLFTATINGTPRQLVGVAAKNGIYYAFDRGNVGTGPLWQDAIAQPGSCPNCGQSDSKGSISPSGWDGRTLYVAGGNTIINGTSCYGSLRAVNPATGAYLWQDCLQTGPVLGAVTLVPGVAVVGAGDHLVAVATSSGQTLFSYDNPNTTGRSFEGPSTIVGGVLYQGDGHGTLRAFSPGNFWSTVAPLSVARTRPAVTVGLDGRIYAIGGFDGVSYLSTVEAYNPSTNTWGTLPPMPTARTSLAAATTGDGLIYAIGGYDNQGNLATVEAYNPSTNTWSSRAPLPAARSALGAATAPNGLIYAVGGYDGTHYLNTVDAYVHSTDSWKAVAPMPTARSRPAVTLGPDGRIYAIGGFDGTSYLSTVEAYNPSTNTWATLAPMPTARTSLLAATGSDGRVYAIGGYNSQGNLSTVEAYSPSTNTWSAVQPAMPTARSALGGAAGLDGRIYAIGGYDGNYLNTVEAYRP